jgi:hypothetical protein
MATPWSVPDLWNGRTVAILASGPSMSAETAELVRNKSLPTIVINTTFHLAPWADMLYAADNKWWTFHRKKALAFSGLKVTCDAATTYPEVLLLRNAGREGFEPKRDAIRTGGNSSYQALHIAVQAGAKRVLLFGVDMKGGGKHWHGQHPDGLGSTSPATYPDWIKEFTKLSDILRRGGVKVINATPGSAMQCFDIQTPEQALSA